MNADLLLFQKIANRLIYLTTRDEFGSSRSIGISTLEELTDDLNDIHVVPSCGHWTKNSLSIFFCRLRKRYSENELLDACDIDFVGRHSWEYQSYTKQEDVCKRRNVGQLISVGSAPNTLMTSDFEKIESWKQHELSEVSCQDKQFEILLRTMKSKGTSVS